MTIHERGETVRREVLGDDYVDESAATTNDFNAPFRDLLTRYAWGEVWSRDGLDRRGRSLVTLAILTALGRFDELELHVAAARTNGVSVDEIREVLLQCAVYCGLPAARTAFTIAERVLTDRGDLERP